MKDLNTNVDGKYLLFLWLGISNDIVFSLNLVWIVVWLQIFDFLLFFNLVVVSMYFSMVLDFKVFFPPRRFLDHFSGRH